MRVWDRFLTEQDRKIYAATDYGARSGLGSRPALVVIDVSYAFTGDVDEPILEAMKKWRTSCGSAGWRAIPAIQELLESARRSRVPVFFSTGVDPRPDGFDRGAWSFKRTQSDDDRPKPVLKMRGNDIVEEVAPLPHEFVIEKLKPSVFHGTPLLGYLVELGVDTLIACGTTTSGCVRATVLDAFNHNLRTAVVEEATFDRFESSHAMTLFDMDAKYADVVGVAAAVEYLRGLKPGLYDDKIEFPASSRPRLRSAAR